MKLDERFTVFGPDRERLVPGKSQVSFELIAGFHAVSAADCNVSATDGPQWILNVHVMNDLPPLPTIEPGRYRHYKGGEYEVLGVVRHSETLEPLVLYRPLYNQSGLWVRPFSMFLEPIEFNGTVQPRFSRLILAA